MDAGLLLQNIKLLITCIGERYPQTAHLQAWTIAHFDRGQKPVSRNVTQEQEGVIGALKGKFIHQLRGQIVGVFLRKEIAKLVRSIGRKKIEVRGGRGKVQLRLLFDLTDLSFKRFSLVTQG